MDAEQARRTTLIIGAACGTMAAFGWAAGFVVAKHGIQIGFSPADIAFHRFFWSGILLLPMILRGGISDLGGIGWPRAAALTITSGPPQSLLAYTAFTLVPLGHGTTIQPACAALSGLILAAIFLGETVSMRRMFGAAAIVVGLCAYGAESLMTIGHGGVAGDLMFVAAGVCWASFGTLLRQWHVAGMKAVAAVSALSLIVFAPAYFIIYGWNHLARYGLWENLLQALTQGILAGVLPIYLFAHAVFALGAGRAGTFPAIVPVFGVIIGFLALGVVPTVLQLVGLVIVLLGFQLTLRK